MLSRKASPSLSPLNHGSVNSFVRRCATRSWIAARSHRLPVSASLSSGGNRPRTTTESASFSTAAILASAVRFASRFMRALSASGRGVAARIASRHVRKRRTAFTLPPNSEINRPSYTPAHRTIQSIRGLWKRRGKSNRRRRRGAVHDLCLLVAKTAPRPLRPPVKGLGAL